MRKIVSSCDSAVTEKKVQFGCRNNANIDVCTPSKKACKCVSDWRANLKKIGVCKPHFSLSGSKNAAERKVLNLCNFLLFNSC